MFSKRLAFQNPTLAVLPQGAKLFKVGNDYDALLRRFELGRMSHTARRSEDLLSDTEVILTQIESQNERMEDPVSRVVRKRREEMLEFVSLGLGRSVSALRDELAAQAAFDGRGEQMGLGDDADRLIRRREAATAFDAHLAKARELGERLLTQIERWSDRFGERLAEGVTNRMTPDKDGPIQLGLGTTDIVRGMDGFRAEQRGERKDSGKDAIQRAVLATAADGDVPGMASPAAAESGDGDVGLHARLARDRRDRLMRLVATLEEESAVMRPGERVAAARTLNRIAQPGQLDLSPGDMHKIEQVEEEIIDRPMERA
ncbi:MULTISPECIES: hypothetical protein [unclassified Burkholderia]|uniref:hypothetical protein n=1 Tax=unclassified Burkholderia TaxID=2613784 RepID=UPI002AB2CD6F|nr:MULTISPECIES: hypothetical protein [unclassified Burkholderia]